MARPQAMSSSPCALKVSGKIARTRGRTTSRRAATASRSGCTRHSLGAASPECPRGAPSAGRSRSHIGRFGRRSARKRFLHCCRLHTRLEPQSSSWRGWASSCPAAALPLAGPLPGTPGLLDPPPPLGAPAPPVGMGAVDAPGAGALPEGARVICDGHGGARGPWLDGSRASYGERSAAGRADDGLKEGSHWPHRVRRLSLSTWRAHALTHAM
jgi:hypothetical protein